MFKLFETFRVVYETQSFSRAAEILYVSQPTVSAQIKQLEAELNTPLFTRKGRLAIQATPQADLVYERCLALLNEWDQLRHEMQQTADHSVAITIGASQTTGQFFLPMMLPLLYQKFPKIQFSIAVRNSPRILEGVTHHELDIGLIEKPLTHAGIRREDLQDDQLVLAGIDNPGPWLLREPNSAHHFYTSRYLEETNQQEPQIEITNNQLILTLLRSGFGHSIISQRFADGIKHRSLGQNYERKFYLLRREQEPSEAVHQVFDAIHATHDQLD